MTFVKEKFVSFMNEGEKLAGMLHVPHEIPAPAMVFCHGFTGNRIESHSLFVHAARELCERGFVVLRFDFRGSGESEGSFESKTVSGEMGDLKTALDWLQRREEVLNDKIGALGLSLGGAVVLLVASEDPRIKAISTWSTPAEFAGLQSTADEVFGVVGAEDLKEKAEKLAEKGYIDLSSGERVGRNFILDAVNHDIRESVRKISRPLLIVHGTEDELVPVSHAEKLFNSVRGPKEKVIVKGADHTYNRQDWSQKTIKCTAEWFEKNLI